jgi:hypothetical protein
MSQNAFSTLAVLAALTFLAMAMSACASSEQPTANTEPMQLAAVELPPGVPEFHGASIGNDSLRGELPSEN